MGCDIHMFVEQRKKIKDAVKWVSGDYFKMNPFAGERHENQYEILELHGNRNYSLFTTLAGVRDYGGKTIPVSDLKGMPDDACDFVNQSCEDWEGDGHSHSWLSLKEIREYQTNSPKIAYSGLLSKEQLEKLDQGIIPNHWCQGTNQPDYERREWSVPNTVLIPLIDKLQQRAYELLQYSGQDYNPENDENIRIVFWFDN